MRSEADGTPVFSTAHRFCLAFVNCAFTLLRGMWQIVDAEATSSSAVRLTGVDRGHRKQLANEGVQS